MAVTVRGRHRALCEILRDDRAAAVIRIASTRRKLTGLPADLCLHDALRLCETDVRQSLMHTAHDLSPDILVETGAAVVLSARLIDKRLVFIAATPDTTHIIWRVSDEPDIDILRRRTGLAGEAHTVEVRTCRRGVDIQRARIRTIRQHGLLHRIGQQKRRRGLHRLPRLVLGRIDKHIALLIEDLREKLRLVKLTAVCDRREGLRELEIRHTMRDTAERQRRVLIAVEQARDAEVLCIQPSLVRIQLLHEAAHRDDVQRVDDTIADRLVAEEAGAVPVLEGLISERIRRIIERRGQCCPIEVDGGCEGRKQLEGRSRLPEGSGRTVQGQ